MLSQILMLNPNSPEPQNITMFEDKVFKGVI